ncbi:MAG: type II secretion system protein [Phycisphaeraceae bacterium]|nr:type II secretion system protein [Phycisphaeraceae bacterium]
MRHRTQLRPCAAFTLVELLVAISVIALLIGIMIPTLAGARDSGRTVVCLSRMRTLGQLTLEFAEANGDEMPRSRHSAGFSRDSWGYVFFEMLTGERFERRDQRWLATLNTEFRCPADPRRNEPDGYIDSFSYGYNVYYELRPDELGDPDGPDWRKSLSAPHPASSVLFGELEDQSVADHAMAHFWSRYNAPPEIEAHRHGDRTNIVFLDTHAETLRFGDTYDPAHRIDRWAPSGWSDADR